MTDPTLERAGVVCPCGARQFWVVDSKACREGIARQRKCRVCGRRLLTVETVAAVTDEGVWSKFTILPKTPTGRGVG